MNKTPRTTKSEAIRTLAAYGHAACDRVEQLETELADKEKQLAEARAEIERLKEYTTCTLVTMDTEMDEKDIEIIKRDKMIKQMRELLQFAVEDWAHKFNHDENPEHGGWAVRAGNLLNELQKAALSAAERGE